MLNGYQLRDWGDRWVFGMRDWSEWWICGMRVLGGKVWGRDGVGRMVLGRMGGWDEYGGLIWMRWTPILDLSMATTYLPLENPWPDSDFPPEAEHNTHPAFIPSYDVIQNWYYPNSLPCIPSHPIPSHPINNSIHQNRRPPPSRQTRMRKSQRNVS